MNNTLKSLIKKTPPMEWLLGRLNKLEKVQKDETAKHERSIRDLNKQIQILKSQNNDLKREMQYLYYKGLHPDQYAENLKEWYKNITGEELDLEHPKTYNEKIQWMKLYDSTPIKTRLADKYLVREWIAEKIGEEYLVPLLGVYDKFDDIDFEKLPNKFVLKTNHGSSWNIIVKDKLQFDKEDAKKKIENWLKKNYAFVFGLELHYLNIPPKIIAEEYLEGFSSHDYKFMCFNGEVKFLWVISDRFNGLKRTLFTVNWERMGVAMHFPPDDREIPKPKNFEKMLEFAALLSKGFAHVRVDFYEANGKLYFGEMTFTSDSGTTPADPKEFELKMGSWLILPDKSEIPKIK